MIQFKTASHNPHTYPTCMYSGGQKRPTNSAKEPLKFRKRTLHIFHKRVITPPHMYVFRVRGLPRESIMLKKIMLTRGEKVPLQMYVVKGLPPFHHHRLFVHFQEKRESPHANVCGEGAPLLSSCLLKAPPPHA